MNIPHISIINEFESPNNNFTFNLFPQSGIFEDEYPKEILFPKDFQEKSENYLLNPKFSSDQIMDSSLLSSTHETSLSQTKNINNSLFLDDVTVDKSSKNIIRTKSGPKFQTEINNENAIQKGLEDKLLMNRLSARKSRLKKKVLYKIIRGRNS